MGRKDFPIQEPFNVCRLYAATELTFLLALFFCRVVHYRSCHFFQWRELRIGLGLNLCGSHYGVDIVVDRAKNLASSTPLNRLRELGFSSVLPPRTEAGFLGTNPTLRDILASGHLSDLRWPDFPDYKIHLTEFYEPTAYGFCGVHDDEPSLQALAMVDLFKNAWKRGLQPRGL